MLQITLRSSVRDMLKWAYAVMEAEKDDSSKGMASPITIETQLAGMSIDEIHPLIRPTALYKNQEARNPLRQIPQIRTSRRPITEERSPLENAYALGRFRHMLPSAWLGSIGPNIGLLPNRPLVNRTRNPHLTIAHWGKLNGFLTAFYAFPAQKTAIIVMANCSPARGDPTDLIAQHLMQNLFDIQPRVDTNSLRRKER